MIQRRNCQLLSLIPKPNPVGIYPGIKQGVAWPERWVEEAALTANTGLTMKEQCYGGGSHYSAEVEGAEGI